MEIERFLIINKLIVQNLNKTMNKMIENKLVENILNSIISVNKTVVNN